MMTDRKKKALNEKLLRACRAGKYDSALKLLEEGADVNARDNIGYTPLMRACEGGHTDIAEELLARGADINAKGPLDRTALRSAVSSGDVKTTKLLIRKGADVKAKDVTGKTAFDYDKNRRLQGALNEELLRVCEDGWDVDYASRLIEYGADINAKNDNSMMPLMTPLMAACMSGYADLPLFLIEKGANVNIKDNFGHTAFDYGFGTLQRTLNGALWEACKEGRFEDVPKWIEKGADVNAKDKDGKTALDCATDEDIRKLLKNVSKKTEPSHLTQTLSGLEEKDNRESDASYTLSEEYARGNDVSFSVSNAALIKNKGR